MKKILLAVIAMVMFTAIADAATFYSWRYRSDATDCTSITDGKLHDLCHETDADTLYKCEPSAGNCDTAGEWKLITDGGDISAVGDCTSGACFAGASGTTLTFNNAGGDGTLSYDGTDFTLSHGLILTGDLTFPTSGAYGNYTISIGNQSALNTTADDLFIFGGTGNGSGEGSSFEIAAGTGGATGGGGYIALTGGQAGGTAQDAGYISLLGGAAASGVAGDGADVILQGGAAGSSGAGGDVSLRPGVSSTSGSPGNIIVTAAASAGGDGNGSNFQVNLGRANGSGTPGQATITYQAGTNNDAEHVALQVKNYTVALSDGATLASQRGVQFLAPTLNGVAGGGTETFTDAATVYINAAPSGSNSTITNAYALWVDAGTARLDGTIQTALTGSRCVETTAGGALTVAASTCGTGGGAFSDASDPIVQNTTTKDVHMGDGAGTLTGKVEIGGDADQPQLVIEGFSTQTDDVLIIQNDADSEVFSVSVAGNVTVAGTVDGVDIAARDHDAVTLAGTPDYLTLSGQAITRTKLDITDDTNLITGTNITLTTNTLDVDDAFLINSGNDTMAGVLTADGLTLGDDENITLGTASDWTINFDDSVDDQLLIATTNTAAIATTDPMVEILVGTTPTADQQVFGVAKGTQATNTPLFTVDEDGDTDQAGTATVGGAQNYIAFGGGYTADPCTAAGTSAVPDNSLFVNTTASEVCVCNGSGVDLRIKDYTTACF